MFKEKPEQKNLYKNPYYLGVDDHLLSKSDHAALTKGLCDFFHMFVDFQFRNSYKPVI